MCIAGSREGQKKAYHTINMAARRIGWDGRGIRYEEGEMKEEENRRGKGGRLIACIHMQSGRCRK